MKEELEPGLGRWKRWPNCGHCRSTEEALRETALSALFWKEEKTSQQFCKELLKHHVVLLLFQTGISETAMGSLLAVLVTSGKAKECRIAVP